MTKLYRRIFVGVLSCIAFVFAGVFFVGCGKVDYSNISVSANTASVDLERGESTNLSFSIENTSKSFYKVLKFSLDKEGVISIDDVKYENDTAVVTISALAGGTANITAHAEEGYKWTSVRVNVVEHSSSMSYDGNNFYLTAGSELSAPSNLNLTASDYVFSPNATDKDVTFYYVYGDANFADLKFKDFYGATFDFNDLNNIVMPDELLLEEESYLIFTDSNTVEHNVSAVKFDGAKVENGALNLYYNGKIVASSGYENDSPLTRSLRTALLEQKFNLVAFYNYSVYENSALEGVKSYLYTMHEAKIYQNLDVSVTSGYIKTTTGENLEKEKTLEFSSKFNENIKLLPNSNEFNTIALKVSLGVSIGSVDYGVMNIAENLMVEVVSASSWATYKEENGIVESNATDEENVFYVIINSSAFEKGEFKFELFARYDALSDVLDDYNVNFCPQIEVEVGLVPTEILFNGVSATSYSSATAPIIIYNYYRYPDFGWKDLEISLATGLDSVADFSYAVVNYESDDIDFKQGESTPVEDGEKIYDLSTPFKYRGNEQFKEEGIGYFTITIHLEVSDGETISISAEVYYNLVKGASAILKDDVNYGTSGVLFVDMQAEGVMSLGNYLYADTIFNGVSIEHISGEDVVSFIINQDCCKEVLNALNERIFVVNAEISARRTGRGTYRVELDNGVFTSMTIEVIDTLQSDNFGVELVSSDYVGYYEYTTSHFEEDNEEERYVNTLHLEILNATDKDTYEVNFGSVVGVRFYGNIISISEPQIDNNDVISVGRNSEVRFNITTTSNGESLVHFVANGYAVDSEKLQKIDTELHYYIDVKSYSLVDEFYLLNDGRYAVDNVVYYGQSSNLPSEATSVTFEVYAENKEAFGFYEYKISDDYFEYLKEDMLTEGEQLNTSNIFGRLVYELSSAISAGEEPTDGEEILLADIDDEYIKSELIYENYNRRFIYFYADANSRSLRTASEATITVSRENAKLSYTVYFNLPRGIIFNMKDKETSVNVGGVEYIISIEFSNVFSLAGTSGMQGRFNFNTFTYEHTVANRGDFVLHSYLQQRNYSEMQYDANITTTQYVEVERVSTASKIDEIAFTNGYLSDIFVVFASPTNATNIDLKAQFAPINFASSDLVTTNIIKQSAGVYLVEVSVEKFYNNNSNINSIEEALSGTLYIFPSEWGDNYTLLGEHTPIEIVVSYRNGSEANRYILDSPEDVLQIGNNEETLSSHYEVRSNIDMSTVRGESIGFLNGELVGFSGSIVGTTSQAGISNFSISFAEGKGVIAPKADGTSYYAGIFAQINDDAYIKNLTISAKFDLNTLGYTGNYRIALLAGINYGRLSNVSAEVLESNIAVRGGGDFAIGGLVGENGVISYNEDATEVSKAGEILQNFSSYAESENEIEGYFTIKDRVGEFSGQTPKMLASFDGKLSINIDGTASNARVYVGGVAGKNSGDIYRIDDESLSIYGYASYSSYANIEVGGGSADCVYLGGAVGYFVGNSKVLSKIIKISNDDYDFAVNENPVNVTARATIFNLLVGGEVDLSVPVENSAVGGIVGYAGGIENREAQQVYLLKNTSRTFIRGDMFTGGIVGAEDYSENKPSVNYLLHETTPSGEYVLVENDDGALERVVLEETKNKIEAVDDGRGVFESSMMLLRGAEDDKKDIENKDAFTQNLVIAIGNSYKIGRNYQPSLEDIKMTLADFDICSYLSRGFVSNEVLDKNVNSLNSYYGDYLVYDGTERVESFNFAKAEANLGIGESDFKMTSENGAENVFLMFNFSGNFTEDAEGIAEEYIEEAGLNKFSPNSKLYPFALNTRDAQILSTSTHLLRVDADGSLTTYSNGVASVSLQSILNIQKSIKIYLYIVDYLDVWSQDSIFYASNTIDSSNIISGSEISVYGTRQTTIHAVPTYALREGYLSYEAGGRDVDVVIEPDGTFNLNNVNIKLSGNESVVVDAKCENPLYTTHQVDNNAILFFGNGDNLQGRDTYILSSHLETEIEGEKYRFDIGASKNSEGVSVGVTYKETATSIKVSSNLISMRTNDVQKEKIEVTSRNDEFVYYEIFFESENGEKMIASKMDMSWADGVSEENFVEEYVKYIKDSNALFLLNIEKDGNTFDLSISINKESEAFKNRKNETIYGAYRITFYANELYDGVHTNFTIFLAEAEITSVEASNYSNYKDISARDNKIVPSRYGLLEIDVSPVEAEFDTFIIKNNAINYVEGAGEVDFTFAYRNVTEEGVTLVTDTLFGKGVNGELTFTYEDYVDYLEERNLSYNGKIYIRYLLSSLGVAGDMPIRFDITVSSLNGQVNEQVNLVTELANYAKLSFNDREEAEVYYVARGLNYGMTLDYFGYALDDIEISLSDSSVAQITGEGRERVLEITDNTITPNDDIGFKLNIYVNASRVIDNVVVPYSQILTVYIMEFVLDYQYVAGFNEDVVRGMEDGVISTAVGNAYKLEVDIWNYLEYDAENNSVVQNVRQFMESLSANAEFRLYDAENGRNGVLITDSLNIKSDYYHINGKYVTGIRLYEPEQDLYHFSMEVKFVRRNGLYVVDKNAVDPEVVYTEFSFYIHQQSTNESPIPVEDIEDLMGMEEGQYYILLNNIVLPNDNSAESFAPITEQVAGFDGNGYALIFSGTYTFETSNIGIFENVASGAVIKNMSVELASNTTFKAPSASASVGLIAGNNAGVITNSEVSSSNNSALSISLSSTDSYVAGFVGRNTGIITNSRSLVSVFSNANLAGFAGTNSGTISSSYFYGGNLRNESTATTSGGYTAGFVVNNSGKINTSYVSDEVTTSEDEVYSPNASSSIVSRNAISGFVFTNSGGISNCYSNIHMNNTSSLASGFVFNNEASGEVSSSISTSILNNNNTLSYGFARENAGTISDGIYLSDNGINDSVGSVSNNERTSIMALSKDEFDINDENFAENFRNFVYSNTRGYNAVWFYNNTNSSAYFNGQNFNVNRLELVAPNIIAFSQRYLSDTNEVVDPETGVTSVVYHYLNTAESGESGTITNPILLDNAENFENYILNENNNNNYNHAYYRVVNNIDYSSYAGNSEIYKTRFMGYFEGNFLTISGVHMVTSENLEYAGFFAEVGSSTRSGAIGTVMNFDLEPVEMVFTNANVSGGIAGRVDSGIVANVNLIGDESTMITANNIAGGVVGLAVGDYYIENIHSDASAKATYIPENNNSNIFEENGNYSRNSYAGAVVGVAGGHGRVNKISVDTGVAVFGGTAGGLIGLVTRDASASNMSLTVNDDLIINAYYYGGLAIGESAGNVENVDVVGTGRYETIFGEIPSSPVAVGGVVGVLSSGRVNNASANQSLSLSSETLEEGVDYLGGFAGVVTGSVTLSNIDVEGSFVGFSTVGGVIGGVTSENVAITISDVNYHSGYLSVQSLGQSRAIVGGLVGYATVSTNLNVTATLSYSLQNEIKNFADAFIKDQDGDENYIEFTEAVGSDQIYSLSTDIFTNDERSAINSAYLSEANKVDFEAYVRVYVYGTTLNIYLGEVVGYTDSAMIYVENTVSVMNADVYSYNMGCVVPTEYTERAYASQKEYSYILHSGNGVTYNGSGTMFENVLDYSATSGVSLDGHIYQELTSTYTPTRAQSVAENVIETTYGFSATFGANVSVMPIFSQNISYTFYMENGESNHSLYLNNYGILVGEEFVGL